MNYKILKPSEKILLILLAFIIFSLMWSYNANATELRTERVASGLTDPLFVTTPPGETDRLFIVEQTGRIKILTSGEVLATPFLDISSLVKTTGIEQGLLGLEFHPDYASNGYFM